MYHKTAALFASGGIPIYSVFGCYWARRIVHGDCARRIVHVGASAAWVHMLPVQGFAHILCVPIMISYPYTDTVLLRICTCDYPHVAMLPCAHIHDVGAYTLFLYNQNPLILTYRVDHSLPHVLFCTYDVCFSQFLRHFMVSEHSMAGPHGFLVHMLLHVMHHLARHAMLLHVMHPTCT